MKKVIFICLLSLSACLSAVPVDDKKSTQPQAPNTLSVDNTNQTQQKPTESLGQTQTDNHTPGQTAVATSTNGTVPKTEQLQNNQTTPSSNGTTVNNSTSTTEKQTDKTAPEKTDPPKDTPPKNPTETKDNAEKVTPIVKPEEHTEKKNETTKQKTEETPTNVKTTETTKAETNKPEVVLQARGFDGPSFIGGIILTLGLIAIGVMGFKYYKAQTERNYHTL